MREAKRKIMRRQDTKRIYLANTTLVVVPGILVQQWQHEMEKHLIEGALRVRVIGKEDMLHGAQADPAHRSF
jgi:N12 class adenine-specific DNA methylase